MDLWAVQCSWMAGWLIGWRARCLRARMFLEFLALLPSIAANNLVSAWKVHRTAPKRGLMFKSALPTRRPSSPPALHPHMPHLLQCSFQLFWGIGRRGRSVGCAFTPCVKGIAKAIFRFDHFSSLLDFATV
ncbi:uncharacterized protein J3D65DRAFT_256006 [Phyllosticta citribraziliensis]|uniref:Secreted protein n=1 Tax=Phyllosticta citribraziliensis TaxID=989973 RepID=A0ABR1M024_9PEZI